MLFSQESEDTFAHGINIQNNPVISSINYKQVVSKVGLSELWNLPQMNGRLRKSLNVH